MGEVARVLPVDPPHGVEATRRRLSPRQAEVVAHLVQATEREIDAVGYPGLTVRNVARQAGVAPATAYNYFSSKDHLLAEVLWRRMQTLPPVDPAAGTWAERLHETVRAMVLFTTESPALVDACSAALMSSHPEVKHLRDRIGATIHRRLTTAMGPGVDPMVVRVLETTYTGALLTAGMGHMPFEEIPDFVVEAARLLARPRPSKAAGARTGAPRRSRAGR
ncbi:MAG: TetR/AcrR family transcriptional regulator [Acidimicrobiales bacterium]